MNPQPKLCKNHWMMTAVAHKTATQATATTASRFVATIARSVTRSSGVDRYAT